MELLAQEKSIQQILEKPLIIGASVSADHFTSSPGKRLALRYTHRNHIHTVAHNGYPGRATLKMLHEKDFKGRTIIIGMDLFFWDATLPNPEISIHALHRLIEKVNEHQIPLILGDIPELLPGWQRSRKMLQDEIHRLCHIHENCLLFPLEHFYKDVLRDGYIEYRGKQHFLWELVPDGLHIGDIAGNFLADEMFKVLEASLPRYQIS